MIKIVLADDEPKVLLLIKNLVRWGELGIEVVGEATDGQEAFRLIQAHRPDIVITDIRMPGMSGLDIIRLAREQELPTNFIVVSGYRQFEYAQTALKYGVDVYLVKPINRQELNAVLVKLRNRILERTGQVETERLMRSQLEQSRAVLRKRFIDTLMFEPGALAGHSLADLNGEYQLNLQDALFQVLNIKLDRKNPVVEDASVAMALDHIPTIVTRLLAAACHDIIAFRVNDGLVCLFNFPLNAPDLIRRSVKPLYEEIARYLEAFDAFDLTIGIGAPVRSHLEVRQSLESAAASVESRIVLGVGRVIDIANYHFESIPLQAILTPESEERFLHLIEALDAPGIKDWIEALFARAAAKKGLNPVVLYSLSRQVVKLFFDGIHRFNLAGAGLPSHADHALRDIDNSRSVPEIKGKLLEIVTGYLDTYLQAKRVQDATPIRIAKQYVQAHYAESITLEAVAGLVNLNPVYFSVVFKKETGVNFSDYLIGVRLEAAKKLLRETRLNLIEIAGQVGYRDPKYFSKLFARVVGIRPQEYRRLYA